MTRDPHDDDRPDLRIAPPGRWRWRGGAAELGAAFEEGAGPGLLALAVADPEAPLPPGLSYARRLARRYLRRLLERQGETPELSADEAAELVEARPPIPGAELIDAAFLTRSWEALGSALSEASQGEPERWLEEQGGGWFALGQLQFHLAENPRDPKRPFAFLATVVTRLGVEGQLQHLPLGRAIAEREGDREGLLALLRPLERAAAESALIAALVESGEVYAPQAWSASQAHALLREAPALEALGLTVRLPDWWRQRSRPVAQLTIGDLAESALSLDALLDVDLALCLDGEPLTPAERAELLASEEGLVRLRGRWVEADSGRLSKVLDEWERLVAGKRRGVSFAEGMRWLAGIPPAELAEAGELEDGPGWFEVVAGAGLAARLERLRRPSEADEIPGLELTLRGYQRRGVSWLRTIAELGLGGCLADDMGLGKTLQVLALLLQLKAAGRGPHLLIVPASLMTNWEAEAQRATPALRLLMAHSSLLPKAELEALDARRIEGVDLVVTTYAMARRLRWLGAVSWDLLILDEAQALKNPQAKQTRAVKALSARARLALTGTPVENRLGDLWSLFDILCPGLLGGHRAFDKMCQAMADSPAGFAPLRRLTSPYILRRLKSDPATISDLPDKTEVVVWCGLTRRQAALYERVVSDLRDALAGVRAEDRDRRGIVLAALTHLKQICNHPAQHLGHGRYDVESSGKMRRLVELCELIAERQERVLVFSQFREMLAPLHDTLAAVFGREGLVIHGGTRVPQRKQRVEAFQAEDGPPFFLLSLKAAGVGLNLTAASHVVHFDRWWNPAVEDQATDRAYRIGQRRNVLVHKLACRGTIEEQVDALIASKRELADSVVSTTEGRALTEFSDDELLRALSLDLSRALAED